MGIARGQPRRPPLAVKSCGARRNGPSEDDCPSILRRERFQEAQSLAESAFVGAQRSPSRGLNSGSAVRELTQSNGPRGDVDIREHRRGERTKNRAGVRSIPGLLSRLELRTGEPPDRGARCPSNHQHRLQHDPRPTNRCKKDASRSAHKTVGPNLHYAKAIGPVVCSEQRAALSGKQAAGQFFVVAVARQTPGTPLLRPDS